MTDWLIPGPPGGGNYNPTFGSGDIWFQGPYGPTTSEGFEYASLLPNPSGIIGPGLLLGSGGGSFTGSISGTTMTVTALPTGNTLPIGAIITGAGVSTGTGITAVPAGGDESLGNYTVNISQTVGSEAMAAHISFNVVTDAPFDSLTPGNDLTFSAGESDGAQPGGAFRSYGGGSNSGSGGANTAQGGSSVTGPGGPGIVQGGNSTSDIPGDAFVIAGEVGTAGATVHLVATLPTGASVPGVIRFRLNSDIMADMIPIGAASAGNQPFAFFLYGSSNGGWGNIGAPLVSGGTDGATNWFSGGFSGTITFGTGHSMTVVNGLITGYT